MSLENRVAYTYLMALVVAIYGRREGLSPSCVLRVWRGTTMRIAPRRPLTVSCPVKHCGKSPHVTWCKLTRASACERIRSTGEVEIRRNDSRAGDEIVSYLTFRRISVHDDGLYRCALQDEHERVSHFINISVSDIHQGLEISWESADGAASKSQAGPDARSWLPYFFICGGMALLVFALTALTHLRCYGSKQTRAFKPTTGQEMPAREIPDLPGWGAPSTPVLQAQRVLKDMHSPSAAGTPSCLISSGNQPLASTGRRALYAVIKHARSDAPAGKTDAE